MWGGEITIEWLPKKDISIEDIRPSKKDMIPLILLLAEHAPTLEEKLSLTREASLMMSEVYGETQ